MPKFHDKNIMQRKRLGKNMRKHNSIKENCTQNEQFEINSDLAKPKAQN